MNKDALINYIENSFLKELLEKKDITDISYNGKDIYYLTNLEGRKKYLKTIKQSDIKDFIRQLANITEKQFSYLSPVLDINVGRYRFNAINQTVGRLGLDEAVTFSLRIASNERKIKRDHQFMDERLENFFDALIYSRISIVICGVTGVGKTEFQKYLVSRMKTDERILIIDNTIELAQLQNEGRLDITLWQADEKNEQASISNLIKNGLRNNPDWMIVSEARGEEMNDVLNSAMTGIPILTTIHSFDAKSGTARMARMIMGKDNSTKYEDIISNLDYHFRIFVHLSKYIDHNKQVRRYIDSIVQKDEDGTIHEIYSNDLFVKKYAKLSKNFANLLVFDKQHELLKGFID